MSDASPTSSDTPAEETSAEEPSNEEPAANAAGSASASDTSENNESENKQKSASESISDTLVSTLQEVIEQRLQWVGLLRRAVERLDEDRSMPAVIVDDVSTLVRLANAWRKGDYPHFPWRSLGVLSLAVLYFFLIRRPLRKSAGSIGLLDDAAVIAFVVRTTHNELNRFRTWERQIASN